MHITASGAIVGVLALAASLTVSPPAQAEPDPGRCDDAAPAPFVDRDDIAVVHRDAVDCLWHVGIALGQVDGDGHRRFAPRSRITRAQFAAMVHRILTEWDEDADLPAPRRPRFDDVPEGHTFDTEIHVLEQTGIVRGTTSSTFVPAAPVRRDQTASLLRRAAEWSTGRSLSVQAGPYYRDLGGNAHRESIDVAFEHGIMAGIRRPCGDGGGVFSPERPTERQQAASVLVRAIEAFDRIDRGEGGDQRGDPECPSPVWEPRVAAARDYAQTRSGSVSFAAVGTDGEPVGSRSGTRVSAASVLKVMFMVAYLRHPDVRDRPLRQSDRDLLEPMIRRSANEPATRIADMLGPGPMERLAERAGMRDFSYTRPWGASQTSARDQAVFMHDLHRHLPSRHRDYALGLLASIVPEQRWGIGEVPTPGWTQHFKGGWGSGSGAVDHQVALLRYEDGTRVAVAVMTTGNPDHEYGKATLRGVFRRLLSDLP
jgi:hypothetical protein